MDSITEQELDQIWRVLQQQLPCGPRESFRTQLEELSAERTIRMDERPDVVEVKIPGLAVLQFQRKSGRQ